MSRSVNNFRTIYLQKNVYILVFSRGSIIGIVSGSCYWYGRLYLLLVFAAVNITGIFGAKYYWYLRAVIITGIVGRRYYI